MSHVLRLAFPMLVLLVLPPVRCAAEEPDPAAAQKLVNAARKAWDVPGIAVVVVRREKTMLHRSNILAGLSKRWFSGDHDVAARNFPSHFIGWAAARGFYPEWFEWAKSSELIDASEEVYRAPFFDPDQPDYPVLLHIAVRAWEAARVGGTGTPKQRIERFVSERYPALKATTRELIAQIANWERTGGRPRQD